MATKTAPQKTSKSGNANRRKVAFLAANDQSPQQIAPQVKLKERRVQQILAEPVTIEMVEHFRLKVERQRQDAEGALLSTLQEMLASDGPDRKIAIDAIERRLAAREKIEIAKAMPVGGSMSSGGESSSGGDFRLEEFFAVVKGRSVTVPA